MKALVGAFNQEKALVGAISMCCVRFQPGCLVCGGGGGLRDPRAALLQLPPRHEPRHAADGGRHPCHLPPRSSGRGSIRAVNQPPHKFHNAWRRP